MPEILHLAASFKMFQKINISFEETKALNALAFDYIHKKENVKSFYEYFPDKKGFSKIIRSNLYANTNRETLYKTLIKQSVLVENTNAKSLANIEQLKNKNVYTVTTGHQLCLFTGPLFFIYKIFSAINLAEELTRTFPENVFVPVYWLAGEDHDFDEVNHFNLYGKNIKWESNQTGAVGEFKTPELENIFPFFKQVMGDSANANHLVNLFERSYLRHKNLKLATRYLINELFGKYGLVTVDGNDPELKQLAKDIFRKDIFENIPAKKVNETIEQLKQLKYSNQVSPRGINCFLLEHGSRKRIEKLEDVYRLAGTEKKFSKQELENIIDEHPEKISPNVVTRPLYQQTILPNIAYVGGPGELAYWLQYKSMFEEFKIQFPVLTPRSFVTIVDKNTKTKTDKLGFAIVDLFKDENELIKQLQVQSNNILELSEEEKKILEIYLSISEKIKGVDKTLVASVTAEEQKALKGIEVIMQKANRALKQRSETEINQLKGLKQKLFPTGVAQERFDNFSAYYSNWGADFFTFLKDHIQPLNFSHNVIIES